MTTPTADATFSDISTAILAQLDALTVTAGGGPFRSVTRFVTDPGNTPPVMPAVQGLPSLIFPPGTEKYVIEPNGGDTLVNRTHAFIGVSTWRVYLLASDVAGSNPSAGVTTIEQMIDLVTAKLSGLAIPGLYLDEKLIPIDCEPVMLRRAQFEYKLRFSARRIVVAVDVADGSVPFHGVHGTVFQDDLIDPFAVDF